MTFSWPAQKQKALKLKLRRAKTLAVTAKNDDFNIRYPDEVRDATRKDFTKQITRITQEVEKYQKLAMDRRKKLAGNK